jgi:hypothetical protein
MCVLPKEGLNLPKLEEAWLGVNLVREEQLC